MKPRAWRCLCEQHATRYYHGCKGGDFDPYIHPLVQISQQPTPRELPSFGRTAMVSQSTICLWYDGTALDAAKFYADTQEDTDRLGAVDPAPLSHR